jgi:hypothetical protein
MTPVFVTLVLADDPVIPLCEMSPPQGRPDSLCTGELISAKRDCVVKQRNAVLVLRDRRRPSGGPQRSALTAGADIVLKVRTQFAPSRHVTLSTGVISSVT